MCVGVSRQARVPKSIWFSSRILPPKNEYWWAYYARLCYCCIVARYRYMLSSVYGMQLVRYTFMHMHWVWILLPIYTYTLVSMRTCVKRLCNMARMTLKTSLIYIHSFLCPHHTPLCRRRGWLYARGSEWGLRNLAAHFGTNIATSLIS